MMCCDEERWSDLKPAKRPLHEAERGFKLRLTETNQGACVWPGSVQFAATSMECRGYHIRLAPHPLPEADPEINLDTDSHLELLDAEADFYMDIYDSDGSDFDSTNSTNSEETHAEGVENRISWDEFLRFVDTTPGEEVGSESSSEDEELVAPRSKAHKLAKAPKAVSNDSSSEEESVVSPSRAREVVPSKVIWSDSSSEEKSVVPPSNMYKMAPVKKVWSDSSSLQELSKSKPYHLARKKAGTKDKGKDSNPSNNVVRNDSVNGDEMIGCTDEVDETEDDESVNDSISAELDQPKSRNPRKFAREAKTIGDEDKDTEKCSVSDEGLQAGCKSADYEKAWQHRYKELKAFAASNGHCLVPVRYESNPSLGEWVRTQRRYRKAGLLPNHREKQLMKLGFTWEKKEEQWENKYNELQEFFLAEGHCCVPAFYQPNPSLGKWVTTQRGQYKRGSLSKDRELRLAKLGFLWSFRNQREKAWEKRYNELQDYFNAEGNCCVPLAYKPNPKLGQWVIDQRKRYKKGSLQKHREQRLQNLGFVWELGQRKAAAIRREGVMIKSGSSPENDISDGTAEEDKSSIMVYRLSGRRKKESRSSPSLNKDNGGYFDEDDESSLSVYNSSRCKRQKKRSTPCLKTDYQMDDTEGDEESEVEIYNSSDRVIVDESVVVGHQDRSSETRYSTKRKPPEPRSTARGKTTELKWNHCRSATLSGSEYSGTPRGKKSDKLWNRRYKELEKYYEAHGTCRVPTSHEENPSLAKWVSRQRQMRNNNQLQRERERKLSQIGFEWNGLACLKYENDMLWMEKYNELVEYASRLGNCSVPRPYVENPGLSHWVHNQRTLLNKGQLTENRLVALERIGFTKAKTSAEIYDQIWNRRYLELKAYKAWKGHCVVPTEYEANPRLGCWVAEQRRRRKQNKLSEDRILKLEALGFTWVAHTAKAAKT